MKRPATFVLVSLIGLGTIGLVLANPAWPQRNAAALTIEVRTAIDRISADSLRGHLSFLASDELMGRATPSPGLDIAAQYIAAQFRRAGLEALGDDGYFQLANFVQVGGDPSQAGSNLVPPGPPGKPVALKNVLGLLRGSDPILSGTYVIVSAHYDHVGFDHLDGKKWPCRAVGRDAICNGANDDASGTVSVIELAQALSSMKIRPKRSIVFAAFFGEEINNLGARYYAQHPRVPLESTIAEIELEQLGRTDVDSGSIEKGPRIGSIYVAKYGRTDMGPLFETAGSQTGTRIGHDERGEAYSALLTNQGIPGHALYVVSDFPDYHGPGDEWEKIDYGQMVTVNRMIAATVVLLANGATEPRFDATRADNAVPIQRWKARHGGQQR